jgi:DNA/RNA-binding domain of Phe-tRNA-synthetase-like protein
MVDVIICEELKKICPKITLGCIQAHVDVESSSDSLWKEINDYCEVLKKEIHIEELASLPRIKEGREIYKKLGKVPSKYRVSSEALIRRILQGKGVYKINNIVDINNLISLKSKFSVGSYNIENLHNPISLMIGKKNEQYKGIGKGHINIENIPVLTDSIGSFGSPTSDSERAMITNNASEILMCIYSFSGETDIDEFLKYGKELLERYSNGKDIEIEIIK